MYTERLDLVVMNGGQGDLPTEEGLAQAVAEVAHVLAANEGDRQQEPVVTALLPHAERRAASSRTAGASCGERLRGERCGVRRSWRSTGGRVVLMMCPR